MQKGEKDVCLMIMTSVISSYVLFCSLLGYFETLLHLWKLWERVLKFPGEVRVPNLTEGIILHEVDGRTVWGLRLSGFSPLRYSCGRLSLEVLPPSSCILQWCLFPAELR